MKTLDDLYNLAASYRGTFEGPGPLDNQKVVQFYRIAGFPSVKHDSVPWCAAFVGAMLRQSGFKSSGSLLARSYLQWGKRIVKPRHGCVAIFSRGGSSVSGHVTFVDAEVGEYLRCLGGNQDNGVTLKLFPKYRLLGLRIPAEIS